MAMQKGFKKMSADTPAELVKLVEKVCKIEGRTRAGFMRFHLEKIALKILKENQEKNVNK